jgi:serine/threonine protein kinase
MSDKYASCLVCPITYSLFSDPVIAEDGHTYERSAITNWIELNGTSPLTRTAITIEGLRPNHLVRSLVKEFQSTLSTYHYKFKLGVDIDRSENPFFQTTGKCFFDAQWIGYSNGPPIVLLKLFGARAEKEASFYERLTRHPHIVYTYGLVEPPQQQSTFVMLLQEKAPGGNLLHFLEHRFEKQPNKPLSNCLLNHMFVQISNAMIFLSEKDIIHGDLACRNILVFRIDEDEPTRTLVKLTDFGISRGNTIYSKIDAVETVIDTVPIRSAAPEVLQSDPIYSEKSDIYAMAVLMWEAFSNGKLPWEEVNKESVVREKVIKGERLSRPENCRSDCQWKLILQCMSQHPDDRPTFQELEKQLREFLIPLIQSTISVRHDYLLEMIKIRDILGCLSTDNHCKSFNHYTTTRNK